MPSDYLTAWNNAQQQQHIARHLLEVTFPLSKDPKILLGVVYNLSSASNYALDALLLSEGILPKPELNQKISDLKLRSKHPSLLSSEEIKFLYSLQDIEKSHQKSPMEFQRDKKLVICDSNYGMKIISPSEVRSQVKQIESLLQQISVIIKRK